MTQFTVLKKILQDRPARTAHCAEMRLIAADCSALPSPIQLKIYNEKVDTVGRLSSREVTGEAIPVGEALSERRRVMSGSG